MTYAEIQKLIRECLTFFPGDAYEAFRQSIVNDLVTHGYSPERAEQVVDDEERRLGKPESP